MPREERSAHVEVPLVKIPGELCESLRCVAEPVEKEHSPRIAGAQVDWSSALDYVCYRNRSGCEVLLVSTLCAGRLPGH